LGAFVVRNFLQDFEIDLTVLVFSGRDYHNLNANLWENVTIDFISFVGNGKQEK